MNRWSWTSSFLTSCHRAIWYDCLQLHHLEFMNDISWILLIMQQSMRKNEHQPPILLLGFDYQQNTSARIYHLKVNSHHLCYYSLSCIISCTWNSLLIEDHVLQSRVQEPHKSKNMLSCSLDHERKGFLTLSRSQRELMVGSIRCWH